MPVNTWSSAPWCRFSGSLAYALPVLVNKPWRKNRMMSIVCLLRPLWIQPYQHKNPKTQQQNVKNRGAVGNRPGITHDHTPTESLAVLETAAAAGLLPATPTRLLRSSGSVPATSTGELPAYICRGVPFLLHVLWVCRHLILMWVFMLGYRCFNLFILL